jgi:hypothetical protein
MVGASARIKSPASTRRRPVGYNALADELTQVLVFPHQAVRGNSMMRPAAILSLFGLALMLGGCDACFNWRLGGSDQELMSCKSGPPPTPPK